MSKRLEYYKEIGEESRTAFEIWVKATFFHPMGDGIRLHMAGLIYLETLVTCYDIDSDPGSEPRPSKHYLFLARFCRKPYYIGLKKITFFDEEEAFLFKLCDGNIDNVQEVSPEKLDDEN